MSMAGYASGLPAKTGDYQDKLGVLCKRARKCKDDMRPWYLLWEELAHYFHNTRKGFITEQTAGQESNQDIWNSSPEQYRRKETEMMVGAMIPKDRMWVGLRPAKTELFAIKEVRQWLEIAALYIHTVLYDPICNFTERFLELAEDVKSFGTGVIYVDHDRVKKALTFMVPHLKNFAFEADASGVVTREYCFWQFSVGDLVDQFGIDALPDEMTREYREGNCSTEKKHCVVHAIIPNDDYGRFGLAPGRMPFKSLWILEKGCHLLDEGGFYDLPYLVPRWFQKSGEVPGRAETMEILPDARLLQSVSAALLEITEKQGNPPMQGPIDILRGEVELFPGGFTAFDASGFQFQGDPLRPVQIGANPAMTADFLSALENKIGRAFHMDLLMAPPPESGNNKPEDAAGRQMMVAAILGPIWSRGENELLPPILDRVFNILIRTRTLPPAPDALSGERLIYRFDNHVSDMREAAEAQRIVQALGVTAQFAQIPQAAEALDNIDFDVAFIDLWQRMKVPEFYVRDPREVAAERQQKAQMQQMAQMAEMAKAGGPGVKSAIEGAVTARDQGIVPPQPGEQ
jgi:hypothetical protein